MNVNSYALEKKITKNIQELLNEGFNINGGAVLERGFWYLNLVKDATYELDKTDQIAKKKTDIQFLSCKFNEIGTICYIP